MTKLPHMTWLRAFEAAARHSSFSAASEELNLTPAAVSQQIKLLEQHLGEPLFRRLPRGVVLTDTGHAYAQPVRKAFAEMQDATTGLFGSSKTRTVHVRASISFAALVLAPQLSAFREAHPDIDLRVTTAVWSDRIEDDASDVEIRFGHGDWAEQDIRHLGHRFAHLVCHPGFARSLGDRLSFQALAAHAVQIIGSETDWDQMSACFGLDARPALARTKVESSLIALQIIAGGTGAAIVSESFTAPYIEQGLLVSPFACRIALSRSFFLIVHETEKRRSEVGHFCDWLMEKHRENNG